MIVSSLLPNPRALRRFRSTPALAPSRSPRFRPILARCGRCTASSKVQTDPGQGIGQARRTRRSLKRSQDTIQGRELPVHPAPPPAGWTFFALSLDSAVVTRCRRTRTTLGCSLRFSTCGCGCVSKPRPLWPIVERDVARGGMRESRMVALSTKRNQWRSRWRSNRTAVHCRSSRRTQLP